MAHTVAVPAMRKSRRPALRRKSSNTISEYLSSYPRDTREILKQLQTMIRNAAPEAEQAIK